MSKEPLCHVCGTPIQSMEPEEQGFFVVDKRTEEDMPTCRDCMKRLVREFVVLKGMRLASDSLPDSKIGGLILEVMSEVVPT